MSRASCRIAGPTISCLDFRSTFPIFTSKEIDAQQILMEILPMRSRTHSFVDQKVEEFYHAGPIAVSDTIIKVRYVLRRLANCGEELDHRRHNDFFCEIIPIASVMGHLEYDDEEIEFTGHDNQVQIDGLLHFPDGRKQNIETTTAINPKDESKSRRHYLQYGYKPVPNQVLEKRPLEDLLCELNENPSLINAKEYDDEVLFPTMQKALCDKIQKSNKNKSYHGAWLILVIDDYISPPSMDAATRLRRFDPLCQRLLTNESQWKPFSRVFVAGISGTYLFDSEAEQGYTLSQCGGGIVEEPITD